MNDVIVIGGGAAGMMAAVRAAEEGADVLLLERNEKLGKKIYITGKGRCNVTNACDQEAFMASIVRNPRFCYAALSLLDSAALMAFFEGAGVPLVVERGQRVFPASGHASDITFALESTLRRLGARVALNARVASLLTDDQTGAVTGVRMEDGRVHTARAVVTATGGCSYPSTGSTGDGWTFAERTGHRTNPPLPALTAIETEETWPYPLTGLSLKNVALAAFTPKGKKNPC